MQYTVNYTERWTNNGFTYLSFQLPVVTPHSTAWKTIPHSASSNHIFNLCLECMLGCQTLPERAMCATFGCILYDLSTRSAQILLQFYANTPGSQGHIKWLLCEASSVFVQGYNVTGKAIKSAQ